MQSLLLITTGLLPEQRLPLFIYLICPIFAMSFFKPYNFNKNFYCHPHNSEYSIEGEIFHSLNPFLMMMFSFIVYHSNSIRIFSGDSRTAFKLIISKSVILL